MYEKANINQKCKITRKKTLFIILPATRKKQHLEKKHPCLANIQQGKRTKSFPKRQPLKAQKAVKFII